MTETPVQKTTLCGARQHEPTHPAWVAATRGLRVCSDHSSNMIWADRKGAYAGIEGDVPSGQAQLIALLDEAIARVGASEVVVDPGLLALRGRSLSVPMATPL